MAGQTRGASRPRSARAARAQFQVAICSGGAMTAEEAEFSKILDSVGADAASCVTHTYHELAFHHIAGSNPDVYTAVNTKAGFFVAMLSGHQTAAFIAMHRLYETEDE